jgi:hypothetical protein
MLAVPCPSPARERATRHRAARQRSSRGSLRTWHRAPLPVDRRRRLARRPHAARVADPRARDHAKCRERGKPGGAWPPFAQFLPAPALRRRFGIREPIARAGPQCVSTIGTQRRSRCDAARSGTSGGAGFGDGEERVARELATRTTGGAPDAGANARRAPPTACGWVPAANADEAPPAWRHPTLTMARRDGRRATDDPTVRRRKEMQSVWSATNPARQSCTRRDSECHCGPQNITRRRVGSHPLQWRRAAPKSVNCTCITGTYA